MASFNLYNAKSEYCYKLQFFVFKIDHKNNLRSFLWLCSIAGPILFFYCSIEIIDGNVERLEGILDSLYKGSVYFPPSLRCCKI